MMRLASVAFAAAITFGASTAAQSAPTHVTRDATARQHPLVFIAFVAEGSMSRAQGVLAEAASAVRAGRYVHILAVPSCEGTSQDRCGCLAERQATAVKGEMMRLGIAEEMIGVTDSTADGPTAGKPVLIEYRKCLDVAGASNAAHVSENDCTGSYAYARDLAERRAAAVKAEMIRLGLDEGMILIIGRSFDEPLRSREDVERLRQSHPVIIELGY